MNNQTSVIAAAMVIAWVIFITVRGELQGYLKVLGIGSGAAAPATIAGGVTQTSAIPGGVTQTGPLTPVDPGQIGAYTPGTGQWAGGATPVYGNPGGHVNPTVPTQDPVLCAGGAC
jgi:hypothetical protein